MREIIYIQAGYYANYIGTHFWNAQEGYLEQEGEGEGEGLIEHDVSFREGFDRKGNLVYTPRTLIFDRKVNFGSGILNMNNDDSDNNDNDNDATWNGDVIEYRQQPETPGATENSGWADLNRVYYHPRSMQILPDIPDWQEREGDWRDGQEMFSRFVDETDVMERSLRSMLEECDFFQGLQVVNDTSSFGSFTYSLLTTFSDELSKAAPIVVPLVGDTIGPSLSRKTLNEAMYLRGLKSDLAPSTTIIPVQSPVETSSSALLSAHVENATIPLRTKTDRETIPIFSSSLNPYGLHRFSQLGGDLDLNFWGKAPTPSTYFSRRDVTRTASTGCITINNTMRSTRLPSTSFPGRGTISSSLSVSRPIGDIFADYARLTEKCVSRADLGVDRDELKELVNDLWTIRDGYGEE